ncbi:uncharacterized protein F5147DRAFT_649573 [Suillus discolor]|uniref:Uncharacterized protein n=1 Tax=Suillus discolor TaxID=1912936 RepID=A0A9P7FDP8_9AGAM|nr:uncharacterized protein F5147DRAFT_649573 [Suillus discolor]KAG2115168.1 hypothetical protein F5147DRAFT_649573 [Suillus discolor]
MACPVIYKTPKVKLQAAHERHRRHYAKNRDNILNKQRELYSSKTKDPKVDTKELLKAVKKLCIIRMETKCLCILKDTKDEMLEMISNDPCKFVEGVLCNYVKSFPEDSSTGDISIIETAITQVQEILDRTIPVQDEILNFCGVSPKWHTADSVTCFLRTVLAYLEDIHQYEFALRPLYSDTIGDSLILLGQWCHALPIYYTCGTSAFDPKGEASAAKV